MKARPILIALVATLACNGSPTKIDNPELLPTGTILTYNPNFPGQGTYLIDVETGAVSQITEGGDPFSLAFYGGYNLSGNFVYGRRSGPPPRHIMSLSTVTRDTTVIIQSPPDSMLVGAFDLSADGSTMAIQTSSHTIQLWTIDVSTGEWTQHVDQSFGFDTIPLSEIRWAGNSQILYATTQDVTTDGSSKSQLIRIDLTADTFKALTKPTSANLVIPSLDLSPDGVVIANGEGGGRIVLRDHTGSLLSGPKIPSVKSSRPRFSPDGKFLAYQVFEPAHPTKIMIMRLSDGKVFPLPTQSDLDLWLSDWF